MRWEFALKAPDGKRDHIKCDQREMLKHKEKNVDDHKHKLPAEDT